MNHNEQPIQVLLVEDSPTNTLLVEEALGQAGPGRFVITQVSRLADALSAIDSSDFDVILLDLGLPDSSGLKTFRAFQTLATHLPVIVLSGLDDEETAVVAVAEGARLPGQGPDDYRPSGSFTPLCDSSQGVGGGAVLRNVQLAELATTDGLTGLRNSRHLRKALPAAFSMAARTQRPLSVIMLDVDFFKAYNDAFGHPAGDEVLSRLGAILCRMTLRTTWRRGMVARNSRCCCRRPTPRRPGCSPSGCGLPSRRPPGRCGR